MSQQYHVILRFEYTDNYRTLISTRKFDRLLPNAKFIEVLNYAPSGVLFLFTCDVLDDSIWFTNAKDVTSSPLMIGCNVGGPNFVSRRMPIKSSKGENIQSLEVTIFHRNKRYIYPVRKNYARVDLVIHSGYLNEENNQNMNMNMNMNMKDTHSLLKLTLKGGNKKVRSVNYGLPRPIHGAKFLRIINWVSSGGYDFITSPMCEASNFSTNDYSVDDPIVAFGVGGFFGKGFERWL